MATTPDLTKTAAKTADAVIETATAAPKAVAVVVEAAPLAAAAVIETVAKVLPQAKGQSKRAAKAKPARKAVRKLTPKAAVTAKRATKPAAKLIKTVTRTTAAKPAPTTKGKTMTDTVKTISANMSAQGEKIVADLKTRTEGAVAKSKVMFTELNDFNKGNVEAIVESGKIAAKGFEKLGQDAAEYTRKSFEQTTSAFKGMAGVKSPTELMKLHSDYVRSSFDAMVAQTSHSTEAMLKLAGEIAQPISNRFAVAAEKVKLAA